MDNQPVSIEELWAVAGKLAWEKYQVEKRLTEALAKIQELSARLGEKEQEADGDGA